MLSPEETLVFTGHPVGGVCPFALEHKLRVFCDCSLERFHTVFPACGTGSSAIKLTCGELYEYSGSLKWIDVCKGWREQAQPDAAGM